MSISRTTSKIKRHKRIRAKISGTSDRPRLCISKSLKHLRLQLIDDTLGKTLMAISSLDTKTKGNLANARILGETIAEKALQSGIKEIVFDRSGYQYHGQIKAIAEAAREKGLIF